MAKNKSRTSHARETAGTIIARENRAQMNGLSGSQRNAFLTRGMHLIHGLSARAKVEGHQGAAKYVGFPNTEEKPEKPIG